MFDRFKNNEAGNAMPKREISTEQIQEMVKGLKRSEEKLTSMTHYMNLIFAVSRGANYFPESYIKDETRKVVKASGVIYDEFSKVIMTLERSNVEILPESTIRNFVKFAKMYENLTKSKSGEELRDRASGEFTDFLHDSPIFGKSAFRKMVLEVIKARKRLERRYFEMLGGT